MNTLKRMNEKIFLKQEKCYRVSANKKSLK